MIDPCPVYTANLFQNWRREVKLRRSAQAGANPTELISQIVSAIPTNSRMGASSYFESTENQSRLRTSDDGVEMPNRRFGKTDAERAWSRLSSFTEFKRGGRENYKDSCSISARRVTRLDAHGLTLNGPIISHRVTQALRIPLWEIAHFIGNDGNFRKSNFCGFVEISDYQDVRNTSRGA